MTVRVYLVISLFTQVTFGEPRACLPRENASDRFEQLYSRLKNMANLQNRISTSALYSVWAHADLGKKAAWDQLASCDTHPVPDAKDCDEAWHVVTEELTQLELALERLAVCEDALPFGDLKRQVSYLRHRLNRSHWEAGARAFIEDQKLHAAVQGRLRLEKEVERRACASARSFLDAQQDISEDERSALLLEIDCE